MRILHPAFDGTAAPDLVPQVPRQLAAQRCFHGNLSLLNEQRGHLRITPTMSVLQAKLRKELNIWGAKFP